MGEEGEEHHHNQLPREWLQDKPSLGCETRRCSQRRRGECFKMPRTRGEGAMREGRGAECKSVEAERQSPSFICG